MKMPEPTSEQRQAQIAFVVPGPPRSWKRANLVRGRLLEPRGQRRLKERVALAFRAACVRERLRWPRNAARYSLDVRAYQRRKASAVPDVDNLAKLVLDALQGLAYEDDARVVRLSCEKLDVREVGGDPRTEVLLEALA